MTANAQPCYASPEKHRETHDRILKLAHEARDLMRNCKSQYLKRSLALILTELHELYVDILMWRPDEEVCWSEFDARLDSIERHLNNIYRRCKKLSSTRTSTPT